jgi:hypothetical protein
MIERVTYARLYALPGFENERFEAVAIVQNGDVDAAFDEARQQVETQYARCVAARRPVAEPPSPPATAKQRNYIATLQDQLCWTSEQLAAYAKEQGVDFVAMSMREASTFIASMKRLNEERSAIDRPPPLADGYLPF